MRNIMGFLDWIKGVGQSVWNGLQSFGRGVGAWGSGFFKGDKGDANSEDVYERLKAAGNTSAGVLKGWLPGAIEKAKAGDLGGVLGSGMDAIKKADRLSRYRAQEG